MIHFPPLPPTRSHSKTSSTHNCLRVCFRQHSWSADTLSSLSSQSLNLSLLSLHGWHNECEERDGVQLKQTVSRILRTSTWPVTEHSVWNVRSLMDPKQKLDFRYRPISYIKTILSDYTFMVLSSFWGAHSLSAAQNILRPLWNHKVRYFVHNFILIQLNSGYILSLNQF